MEKIKKAFTLAEVLITLTIIGVIAAITIPNLMQNWRKHEVEVKVKEAYSILNNAIRMAEAEHGSLSELLPQTSMDYQAVKEYTYKYLLPYLKIEKDCGSENAAGGFSGLHGKGKSCLPYPTTKLINNRSIPGVDGETGAFDLPWSHRIILANGMILGIKPAPAYATNFFVDINGQKGPNQVGYDIFAFTIYNPYKDSSPQGQGKAILYGGAKGYGSWETYWNPNRKCEGEGLFCTTLIMKNGWKIPDDYPVKRF